MSGQRQTGDIVQKCPWCSAVLVPYVRTASDDDGGIVSMFRTEHECSDFGGNVTYTAWESGW